MLLADDPQGPLSYTNRRADFREIQRPIRMRLQEFIFLYPGRFCIVDALRRLLQSSEAHPPRGLPHYDNTAYQRSRGVIAEALFLGADPRSG